MYKFDVIPIEKQWEIALTWRQLRDKINNLSDKQLDEKIVIEQHNTVGGKILLPITHFNSKSRPELGIGPCLVRYPAFEPRLEVQANIV